MVFDFLFQQRTALLGPGRFVQSQFQPALAEERWSRRKSFFVFVFSFALKRSELRLPVQRKVGAGENKENREIGGPDDTIKGTMSPTT